MNYWPTPLQSCVVEVWAPVPAAILPQIQEYPLWWPEHEGSCEQPAKPCTATEEPDTGNSIARTIIELLIAKDTHLEPLSDAESSDSSQLDNMSVQSTGWQRDLTYRPCACEREPFEHISEICFMSYGYLLQGPLTGRKPSFLRLIHPDITIFAAWEAAED